MLTLLKQRSPLSSLLYLMVFLFVIGPVYGQEPENTLSPAQYDKHMQKAAKEAGAGAEKCKGERTRHELKNHVQFAKCVNQAVSIAYERAGYLYPDLTASLNAKRLDIAQRVDQKKLTEAQGNQEFLEFSTHISEEEIKRNNERKASLTTTSSGQ